MPRKFFKRYAPSHQQVREHKYLKIFGSFLCQPNIWHFNRRSVSGAFAIGLFWAFIPIPFQTVIVAVFAILLRVNLPISIALVWITNPITIPPIYYAIYLVGSWVLNTPPMPDFSMTMEWIGHSMSVIWKPMLTGSILCGLLLGGIGYASVQLFWRLHLMAYLKRRAARKQVMKQE